MGKAKNMTFGRCLVIAALCVDIAVSRVSTARACMVIVILVSLRSIKDKYQAFILLRVACILRFAII